MGSPPGEDGRSPDETQHEVVLHHNFLLLTTEVTQTDFLALMGYNPSFFRSCLSCPVEQVSWHEAAHFCNMLSESQGFELCYDCVGVDSSVSCRLRDVFDNPYQCEGYRLPTESEWEYAARAGTTGARYGDLDSIGWSGDADGSTHPVGQKLPNSWGLYDMIGNVFEWCSDWYGSYPPGPVSDPWGPRNGTERVIRGGSWNGWPRYARSAFRGHKPEGFRNGYLGFRPSRTVVP